MAEEPNPSNCTHDCSSCGAACAERKIEKAPMNALSNVKKVIAVMSGKGGVGKSLSTALLATNAMRDGKKVAILDADVTGPSIPTIFGIPGMAEGDGENIYPRLSKSVIKVMSLVAQGDGIKQLKDAGVDVYYSKYAPKAIEESNATVEEKIWMYYQMDAIESKIPSFNNTYHYGYNRSEALVSMIRCPNNTFPIYWYIPNISPYERIQ